MKIKFNQKLLSIFNYIDTCENPVSFTELVDWSVDMDCYKELFVNMHIIEKLRQEHNTDIELKKLKELEEND